MKKILTLCVAVALFIAPIFAQAGYEAQRQSEIVNVNLAVMKGPTGFGAAGLVRNDGVLDDTLTIKTKVYGSPTEVIAKLANGEEDIAALPSNLASVLYNKGIKIKLAAVIGNGMLSVISSEIDNSEELIGKSISIPGGPASTPNQLTQYLIDANGFSQNDFTLEYGVTSAAQLSQLLIAEKVKTALLPEPFTTMVLKKNKNIKIVLDAQKAYEKASLKNNYPMTVLVVQEKFLEQNPKAVEKVLKAYKESIEFVVSNPSDAGTLIEGIGIMPAAMATPAIPNCNLVYVDAETAKDDILGYYEILFKFNPKSIGGKLPPVSFFM